MLDVRYIRENTERCKARLAMRGRSYDAEIDRILELEFYGNEDLERLTGALKLLNI